MRRVGCAACERQQAHAGHLTSTARTHARSLYRVSVAAVGQSSCNHLGNEAVLDALCAPSSSPCAGYDRTPAVPWPSAKQVDGYLRTHGNLSYATVLRTGHLVPTVVPKVYATLLDMFIGAPSR
jgi:hypothetical protein